MAKTLDTSTATEANPIISDLRERTTLYSTSTSPFHKKAGEEWICHPSLVKKYVSNGWATEDKKGKATKEKEV